VDTIDPSRKGKRPDEWLCTGTGRGRSAGRGFGRHAEVLPGRYWLGATAAI
jgi:hypothetical protein